MTDPRGGTGGRTRGWCGVVGAPPPPVSIVIVPLFRAEGALPKQAPLSLSVAYHNKLRAQRDAMITTKTVFLSSVFLPFSIIVPSLP